MILLPRAVRVYVATAPCNLRKSFEGLSNEVRCALAQDPLSGHVFVFLNRRKTHVKLLWFPAPRREPPAVAFRADGPGVKDDPVA